METRDWLRTSLRFCFCLMLFIGSAPAEAIFHNLDDDPAAWGIFIDPPGNTACPSGPDAVAIPGGDGTTLHLGIASPCPNATPYTGIHFYRNLTFVDANNFQLDLQWQYQLSPDLVQAFEFTMNKFTGTLRYEWALQFENIGDGTPNQGNAPTWRIWNGTDWIAFNYDQNLAPDTWHHLTLVGDIQGGQVHYQYFISDAFVFSVGRSYDSVPSSDPAKLAVAAQIDGDQAMNKQDLYLDRMSLSEVPEPSAAVPLTVCLGLGFWYRKSHSARPKSR